MSRIIGVIAVPALLGAMTSPATAASRTTTTNITEPLEIVVYSFCFAEGGPLQLFGDIHQVTVTVLRDSGEIQVSYEMNTHLEGANLSTGDYYRVTQTARYGRTLKPAEFPITYTNLITEHFVSPTGPDLLLTLVNRVTIYADGSPPTSDLDVGHVICR